MGGLGGATVARPLAVPGVGLAAAYAWWAVGREPFSGPATAAVVGGGAAAMAVGALARPRGRRPRARSVVPWAVLALVGGAWQVAAYLQHPRAEHPTLSSLANAVLDSRPARAGAFVLWLGAAALLGRR